MKKSKQYCSLFMRLSQNSSWGTLRIGLFAAGVACVCVVGLAHSECIDYEDYLRWVGGVDTPGYAHDVVIAGNYAYVADSDLQVIDISNPESPQIVGGVVTTGGARGVAISGSYAYVADYSSGLQVIDISDSVDPQLVGGVDTPGDAWGVAISGSYAYVADRGTGLQVVNISNPASPQIEGCVDTPGSAQSVVVSGDYAFVADYSSGLQDQSGYRRKINCCRLEHVTHESQRIAA